MPPLSTQLFCKSNCQILVALGHRSGDTHMRNANPLDATISSALSEKGLFFTAQHSAFAKENR